MNIEMIGINHETSDIAARDRATINPERFSEVSKKIAEISGIDGSVILSTCNRVEIYTSPQNHLSDSDLKNIFGKITGLDRADYENAYIYRDEEAVRHLFRVASGLNSQLLGEVQILGQVKSAYYSALEIGSVTGFLNRLFLKAIECGKFARERTAISQGAVSAAYAAVDLAGRIFGNLEKLNLLLIGAGDTGKLAALHFHGAGVSSWKVSNRTRERAETLAQELGGETIEFPPSAEDINWADIVVSATGAPGYVIEADGISDIIKKRENPICFLDLAVPRDIDPELKEARNAFVYSIDDFNELVESNLKARRKEAERAEKLVLQKVDSFVKWHRENRVAPTIHQLQEIVEGIRLSEIEKSAKKFCEADRETIEKLSKSLVKKIISLIILNMKKASVDKDDLSLARSVLLAFSKEDESIKKTLEKLDHELSHQ
ncbi:MAG: glutamyl-tRNA reductase [Candidatus Zixiibacteriota bacterium]|nr:MAG: glutamyl-tRNA reductase [candidate division Zixibacteria bacterium]